MGLVTQLILYTLVAALFLVVGSFIFIMMDTILDTIEEHQQARERDKRRE